MSGYPGLRIGDLFGRGHGNRFPLDAPGALLCLNARVALWYGLDLLKLGPGDRVLVPNYACGSELDVLIARGLVLDFYRIDRDLAPDMVSLEAGRQADTRAVLVIHYFGFSQPMDELLDFVRAHDLALIEDNAHGLFSCDPQGRPLGSRGNIGVFSLYKVLPVPDGGVLMVNHGPGPGLNHEKLRAPPLRTTLGTTRVLLERSVGTRFPGLTAAFTKTIADPLARGLKRAMSGRRAEPAAPHAASADHHRFSPEQARWAPAPLTRLLLRRCAADAIVERRRHNYRALEESLHGLDDAQPLMRDLHAGCSPLFMPVLERNATRPLRRRLLDAGIECHGFGFPHPAIPVDGYPWEADLKSRVTCLAVHQDLTARDLERIIDIVTAYRSAAS